MLSDDDLNRLLAGVGYKEGEGSDSAGHPFPTRKYDCGCYDEQHPGGWNLFRCSDPSHGGVG